MSILGLNCSQTDFGPIFPQALPRGEERGFSLFAHGPLLLGVRSDPAAGSLCEATRRIYRDLLAVAGSHHLYRVWNQVPQINAVPTGTALENYRAFSAGRAETFEERHGGAYCRQLPAASAVGCEGDELTVAFVAGPERPIHFENPEQVPAYRYPEMHGPRPPSFARATRARVAGQDWVYVSGTAAIKGHLTVAPDDLERQVECTLDNLRLISQASGVGEDLGAAAGWRRHFKVYFRAGLDLAKVEAALQRRLLGPADSVVWRQADLCRSALKVEIEASLWSLSNFFDARTDVPRQ